MMRAVPAGHPEGREPLIAGYIWMEVERRKAPSTVYRLSRPKVPTLFLKIARELAPERDRLQWLRGQLPVPAVLAFAASPSEQFLLLSAIPGIDVTHACHLLDTPRLVELLAEGQRMVHEVPIGHCPFDARLDSLMATAESRVRRGLVDEDDFEPCYRGRRAADLLVELIRLQPTDDDLVFTHGDFCLPNVLIHEDHIAGFVDLGRAGVSDRYRDLALTVRSLRRNFGDCWVTPFFEAYGIAPDERKIEFYILLDEFL